MPFCPRPPCVACASVFQLNASFSKTTFQAGRAAKPPDRLGRTAGICRLTKEKNAGFCHTRWQGTEKDVGNEKPSSAIRERGHVLQIKTPRCVDTNAREGSAHKKTERASARRTLGLEVGPDFFARRSVFDVIVSSVIDLLSFRAEGLSETESRSPSHHHPRGSDGTSLYRSGSGRTGTIGVGRPVHWASLAKVVHVNSNR